MPRIGSTGVNDEAQDERSDEQVMGAYAAGEPGAFDELFRRYARRLFGYLFHMTMERELARDLVQETFVRVHRARDQYDAGRPFKPWLFRIATNVCADEKRSWFEKLARRTTSLFSSTLGREPAAADGDRPDRRVERSVLGERFRAEIGKLPEPYRQVILLHELEGLTCEETATALDKPLGTVLSLLSRGRGRLRERLEKAGGKQSWM